METTECKHRIIHNGVCLDCGRWQHAQTFHSGGYIDDRLKQLEMMYESAASRCRVAENERDALKKAANVVYERYHEFVRLTYDRAASRDEIVANGLRFGESMGKLMRLVNPGQPDGGSPDTQETS